MATYTISGATLNSDGETMVDILYQTDNTPLPWDSAGGLVEGDIIELTDIVFDSATPPENTPVSLWAQFEQLPEFESWSVHTNLPYEVVFETGKFDDLATVTIKLIITEKTPDYNDCACEYIGLVDRSKLLDGNALKFIQNKMKESGNTLSDAAPTTSTAGVLGQLYTDTTNMHTYQCTAVDTTDPDNPVYTWTQRW